MEADEDRSFRHSFGPLRPSRAGEGGIATQPAGRRFRTNRSYAHACAAHRLGRLPAIPWPHLPPSETRACKYGAVTLCPHAHLPCPVQPQTPEPAEELRKAAEYDFGTATSPRASYHTRDHAFAFVHGGDFTGSAEGLSGLEWPAEGPAKRGVARQEADEVEEAEEEEEGGEELLVRGVGQTGRLCLCVGGAGGVGAACG